MAKPTTATLIHEHLIRTGMTESELAELVGVDQTQVSRWRRGTNTPRAASVPALADALDLDVKTVEAARAEGDKVRRQVVAEAEAGRRTQRQVEAENRKLRAEVKRLEARLRRLGDD